jgi:hypothetical protein
MNWQDFTLKILHLFFVEALGLFVWPFVVWQIGRSHREEVKGFLGRLIKLGPTGAEAVPPSFAPQSSVDVIKNATTQGLSLPLPPADEVIAQIEQNVIETLKQRQIDLDKLSESEKNALFLREYATLARNYHFDMIANQIFGTQVAVLRQLDNSPSQSKRALDPIFEEHVQKVKERDIPPVDFFGWISFLLNTKLVAINDDGNYIITAMGRQFLQLCSLRVNETTRLF